MGKAEKIKEQRRQAEIENKTKKKRLIKTIALYSLVALTWKTLKPRP
ncbi:hypothetical protein HGB13_04800 [bacterium]|nr:hypothetical protein [bacterium]